MSTKIEWTDETWNPVRGCTIVSEGCKNCYAMKFAHRFSGEGKPYEGLTRQTSTGPKWTGKTTLVYENLHDPLRWKKPRRIFVCSMSDLFHEKVPFEYIEMVFDIMASCPQHTFQILTKRPERAMEFSKKECNSNKYGPQYHRPNHWPYNVWIGTSVENQKTANERIPHLLEIPAVVRFLSCEPLINNVFIRPYLNKTKLNTGVSWVIAGGESGPGARPMHPDWVRSLRDQCEFAEVPFFFKQWGEWLPNGQSPAEEYYDREDHFSGDPWDYFPYLDQFDEAQKRHEKKMDRIRRVENGMQFYKYGKKYTGNWLDARQHLEFPCFTKATEGRGMRKRCYIAGKIGSLPAAEYIANFEKGKQEVIALGYEPVSPLDLPHDHDRSWRSYMKEDLTELMKCDALYALHNWIDSPGASLEIALADRLGIRIIFQPVPSPSETYYHLEKKWG